jgi:hypothetical protein
LLRLHPATSGGQGTGGMNFRDDFLMNSPGMLSGNGIAFVLGSFVQFGNTATFNASGGQINPATHTDGAAITTTTAHTFALELGYSDAQAMTVLTELTQAADHLPVVADYQLTSVPEPTSLTFGALAALAGLAVRRIRARAA